MKPFKIQAKYLTQSSDNDITHLLLVLSPEGGVPQSQTEGVDVVLQLGALDLVVLEQDVGAVELDRLVNDVVRRCIRAVLVLGSDRVERDTAGLLDLLTVEL